jgi:hypothetical protein
MHFRITGLNPESFLPLYGLSDEQLAARGAQRLGGRRRVPRPDRTAGRATG